MNCKYEISGNFKCIEKFGVTVTGDADDNDDCRIDAMGQQCNNPWTRQNCPKNCKLINEKRDNLGANLCKPLAENGFCGSDPNMMVYCANTCSSKKVDLHKDCLQWSQQGECAKNPNYMKYKCRKSCNT